jgi:hypothetical protein
MDTKEKKEDKLTTKQICLELQLNTNTRKYVEYKYKDEEMTLKDWKTNLKKDALNLK